MKLVFLSAYSGMMDRGIESWMFDVGQILSKNHQVTVFQHGKPLGTELYDVKQIKLETDHVKLRKFAESCYDEIIKIKPDIIIPLNGFSETIKMKRLAKKINAKVVWIHHFFDITSLLARPDLYIALTPFNEKLGAKVFGLKTALVPHGINTDKFTPEGEHFKHNLKHPVILNVGALITYKNPDKTIYAVSKLKNVSLLMVGSGNKKYIDLGEKLLGDRFQWIEAKYSDMPSIYRSADVFTSVSKINCEAFGLVNAEAISSGLPVVVTDDFVRHYIVGDAGLYVKPNDIDEYAKALQKALDIKWGNRPREQALKMSVTTAVSKYEKAFEDLIKA